MTMIQVPLNKLFISEKNVSTVKPDKTFLNELRATLKSVGQIQNLCVFKSTKKKGFYEVFAGGKRYIGFDMLAKAKEIPKDVLIDCKLFDASQATEISAMENMFRIEMHPADAFMAFQRLVDEGYSIKDITGRFGYSQKKVKQFLKMANVSLELIQLYRDGKVMLDEIMAYTITDDHDKQLACHKEFKGYASAYQIRNYLTHSAIRSDDVVVKFVKLAAYKKAGGATSSDLFQRVTYLEDAELLTELADQKLEVTSTEVMQEGWKWVEISREQHIQTGAYSTLSSEPTDVPKALTKKLDKANTEYQELDNMDWDDMTDEQDTRFNALEEEIAWLEEERDQYRTFKDTEKPYAGCIVHINQEAEISVIRGLVLSSDRQALAGESKKGQDDQTSPTLTESEQEKPVESNALVQDLGLFRQQVVQACLAKKPKLANDILLYTLCSQVLNNAIWATRMIDARFDRQVYPENAMRFDQTRAGQELAALDQKINTSWFDDKNAAEQFRAFCALSKKEKDALMAYCVALSFQLPAGAIDTDDDLAPMLDMLGCNIADYWRPSGSVYFSRISKDPMLNLGKIWHGEEWVNHHKKLKKGDLVEVMDNTVNGDQSSLDKEIVETINQWLPEPMTLI